MFNVCQISHYLISPVNISLSLSIVSSLDEHGINLNFKITPKTFNAYTSTKWNWILILISEVHNFLPEKQVCSSYLAIQHATVTTSKVWSELKLIKKNHIVEFVFKQIWEDITRFLDLLWHINIFYYPCSPSLLLLHMKHYYLTRPHSPTPETTHKKT